MPYWIARLLSSIISSLNEILVCDDFKVQICLFKVPNLHFGIGISGLCTIKTTSRRTISITPISAVRNYPALLTQSPTMLCGRMSALSCGFYSIMNICSLTCTRTSTIRNSRSISGQSIRRIVPICLRHCFRTLMKLSEMRRDCFRTIRTALHHLSAPREPVFMRYLRS